MVEPPLWKMMEFVSWDDYSIPNWMESHKIHVPNHQPDIYVVPSGKNQWGRCGLVFLILYQNRVVFHWGKALMWCTQYLIILWSSLPQKTILIHRRSSPRRIHRDLWQSNRRFLRRYVFWLLFNNPWDIAGMGNMTCIYTIYIYIHLIYIYIFTLYI